MNTSLHAWLKKNKNIALLSEFCIRLAAVMSYKGLKLSSSPPKSRRSVDASNDMKTRRNDNTVSVGLSFQRVSPLLRRGISHDANPGNPWVISRIGSIPPLLGSAPSFRGRSAGSFPEQLLIIEHISRDERNIYHATHAWKLSSNRFSRPDTLLLRQSTLYRAKPLPRLIFSSSDFLRYVTVFLSRLVAKIVP